MFLIPSEFKYNIAMNHFVIAYVNLYIVPKIFNCLCYCNMKKNLKVVLSYLMYLLLPLFCVKYDLTHDADSWEPDHYVLAVVK